MTIEVATYINDLQPVNPTSTDQVSQGDDHLRLIKQVLQNTFPGATRAMPVPTTIAYSGGTALTVLKAWGGGTVYVSTAAGAVVATLPSLTTLDQGWSCNFVKTSSDANPIFVTPPSGTINSGALGSFARARRCVPGVPSTAIWDGANWFITRVSALPVGSCIEFHGSSLPAGYEWPNGQTLSSATNYPEYNSAMGGLVTLDKRGRMGIPLDNLGGTAAGRLAGGFITGTAVGNVGGTDGVGLVAGHIPNLTVSASGSISGSGTFYPGGNSALEFPYAPTAGGPTNLNFNAPGGGSYYAPVISTGVGSWNFTNSVSGSVSGSCSVSGTATGSGTSTGVAHNNLMPSIMVSQILVVE